MTEVPAYEWSHWRWLKLLKLTKVFENDWSHWSQSSHWSHISSWNNWSNFFGFSPSRGHLWPRNLRGSRRYWICGSHLAQECLLASQSFEIFCRCINLFSWFVPHQFIFCFRHFAGSMAPCVRLCSMLGLLCNKSFTIDFLMRSLVVKTDSWANS